MDKQMFPVIMEEVKLPFYVFTIGGEKEQDTIFRPQGFSEYHWLHTVSGKGKLILDKKEYTIKENMGFLFYPGIKHEYYPVEKPWHTHWITFNGTGVLSVLEILGFKSYSVFYLKDRKVIDHLLEEIFQTMQSTHPSMRFKSSALLYQFLLSTRDQVRESPLSTRTLKHEMIKAAMDFIEKNYDKPLQLRDISQSAGCTSQYICRVFKDTLHIKPFEYLTQVRIQKAKQLLSSSSLNSVGYVAAAVGYEDPSYFCYMFKRYTGMTPLSFRQLYMS